MEIKEYHLQRFIHIYRQEFGIVLTPIEAQPKLHALVTFALLCQMPVAKVLENDINNMPD